MRAVIIYYSKTGFTRRYAEWLAETLKCDCIPYERRAKIRLKDYDAVIFGSWLRAGAVQKLGWLKAKLPELAGKRIIAFAVGAMPAEAKDAVRKVFERNFTAAQRSEIQVFYLQGGLDYGRMDAVSRIAMRMMCRMLRGQKNRSAEDEALLHMIQESFDGTNRSAIEPIVAAVEGMR